MSNFKTVQLKEEDMQKLESFVRELQEQSGMTVSKAQAIMYAVKVTQKEIFLKKLEG